MLSIVSDASGRGIGGILQVRREGEWWPAAYYSRQLRGVEHRYSATELEALALTETIRHFSYHLYGRQFQAYTDHKPLEQLTTSTRLKSQTVPASFQAPGVDGGHCLSSRGAKYAGRCSLQGGASYTCKHG